MLSTSSTGHLRHWAQTRSIHSTGTTAGSSGIFFRRHGPTATPREELVAELGAVLLGDRAWRSGLRWKGHCRLYGAHWIGCSRLSRGWLFQVLSEARQAAGF